MTGQPHISVLFEETMAALALAAGDVAVDCTVGAGGHAEGMARLVGETGRVIGLDRDESALALARARLEVVAAKGRVVLVHAPFSEVERVAREQGVHGQVAGVLADVGVSSMHLDQGERGFSFQKEGPLDMRMDRSRGATAADVVNELGEAELAKIFFEYGEEPQSRQIARRIAERRRERPFATTLELAELVRGTVRYKTKSERHPATKVFQALRIHVNDELGELRRMIDGAFAALRPRGRLAVISFHSLEDRIVKNAFLDMTARRERAQLPRNLPLTEEQVQRLAKARGEVLKPFPTVATDDEIRRNPRARSAKLRVLVKL